MGEVKQKKREGITTDIDIEIASPAAKAVLVGLLALVTVWNVDIGLDRPDNMYEVSDVVEGSQNVQKDNLQEAGKVYRDPDTGNLYFIEE